MYTGSVFWGDCLPLLSGICLCHFPSVLVTGLLVFHGLYQKPKICNHWIVYLKSNLVLVKLVRLDVGTEAAENGTTPGAAAEMRDG